MKFRWSALLLAGALVAAGCVTETELPQGLTAGQQGIGGAIAQAAGSEGLGDFSWRALLIACLGACLLLLVLQAIGGRRGSSGRRR